MCCSRCVIDTVEVRPFIAYKWMMLRQPVVVV